MAALEARLGIVLFERIGKSLQLTGAGRELLEHVRAMGEAAQHVSLTAAGQSQTIAGSVSITASDLFAAHTLPEVLGKLRKMAPNLEIDVVATNDISDLQRREADIAIRHIRPDQPELIARLVAEATASFYASRLYLESRGRPRSPADLARHDMISFGDIGQMLSYLDKMDIALSRDNFRLNSASGVAAWQMAVGGLGIAIMSDDVAGRTPDMERLFPNMAPIIFPVWLATHRELHTSRRIRLVYDLLAEFLSDRLRGSAR